MQMFAIYAVFADGSEIRWLRTPHAELARDTDLPACERKWSELAPSTFVGAVIKEERL